MNVQPTSQTTAQSLHLQAFAPGPLGTVGNQRFQPEQGGTARASRRAVPTGLRSAWARLKFRFNRAPAEVREQHDNMIQWRDNSRRIGNMLGLLTAGRKDARAQARVIRELEQLAALAQGDLANLPGATQALLFYVGELTRVDLLALRNGVLGHRTARAIVLDQVSRNLNAQAAGVLNQISSAVSQRLAQGIMQEPLHQLRAMMLDAPVVLAKDLAKLLITLGPEQEMLRIYLRSLPQAELRNLSLVFKLPTMVSTREVIGRIDNELEKEQALNALAGIQQSVEHEIHTRLQPLMNTLNEALLQAGLTKDQFAASRQLLNLASLVEETQLTYGCLPGESALAVRRLIFKSLPIFQDDPKYRYRMVNAASLSKLDDATLQNLREAAWHLSRYGLVLDVANETSWRLFEM